MTEPRTTTHQAPLPLLRAAVFATVGTVLGVSARHLVAGGPVPWRQGAAAMAALLMVGLVGARRRRSLGVVVATCGLAQAWLHSWFMADHSDGRPESVRSGPAHMHHAVGAHEVWHERLHASSALTVAHAVAALLVGVLLHRGDTVCWSLARGLTAVVAAVRVPISRALALLDSRRSRVRFPAPLPAASWLDRPPPQGAVLADVIVRRGLPGRASPSPSDPAGTALGATPRSLMPGDTRMFHALKPPARPGVWPSPPPPPPAPSCSPRYRPPPTSRSSPRRRRFSRRMPKWPAKPSRSSRPPGSLRIRVVLPKGIDPADVTYQDGPKGWKFTAGADGCTIGGPALKTGENARYSVLVKRLPDVRELAFKTLQSHSDGRVDRWIALDEGAENPAPVLELGAAVPGARATGSPGASAFAPASASPAGQGAEPSSSPAAEAKKDDDGGVPTGAWAGIGAAALAVVAVVFAVRRRSAARR